ncbi:MAG: ZIP family metal transporter [Candidatus Micrarchaeia archaeon]
MDTLSLILVSVFIVSLISFVGVFSFAIRKKLMEKLMFFLVSFAAGAMFGGAFLHMLPEAAEKAGVEVLNFAILGILLFFILERFLHWQHCHNKPHCKVHTFAYMNLVGDGVHNFIDGFVIGASYLVSTQLGVASTIAIVLHEIPQELGDFAVLLYGGFTKERALILNFLTALTAVLGAVAAFYVMPLFEGYIPLLLSFAAGGFIYVAGSDLVPELRKEVELKNSVLVMFFMLMGVGVLWLTKIMR